MIIRGETIAPRILSPPELPDGFGRVDQPIGIGEERNQFDGAKVFHGVGLWLAKSPKLSSADENSNAVCFAVQMLRYPATHTPHTRLLKKSLKVSLKVLYPG